MTREQAREAAAIMLAWADGKEVQHRTKKRDSRSGLKPDWCDTDSPWWDFDSYDYRIKSTAKVRPWTVDEVPLGSVVRYKTDPQRRFLLVNVESELGRRELFEKCEVSAGCGFKWLPCGVVEESK